MLQLSWYFCYYYLFKLNWQLLGLKCSNFLVFLYWNPTLSHRLESCDCTVRLFATNYFQTTVLT